MKVYQKPALYAESYALAEHISQSCVFQTNFGNQCPITDAGVTFFTTASACSEDGVSMIEFKYGPGSAATVTVEQLIGLNIQCYNSLQDYHQLFTS